MDDIIKTLADGTLDAMRLALSGLGLAQLTALKAAEEAGKKRGGAIEMIDDAIALLDDGSKPDVPDDLPPPDPLASERPPQPELDPIDATVEAPIDAKQPIRLVVAPDRIAANARLARALADGDSVAIVFADADGGMLPVPPIEAKPHAFQQYGGQYPRLIYKPRIDLPMTLPSVAVRQLFLLVEPQLGDDAPAVVAVCRLTGDLFAGGGRRAEIPDGNLLFSLS